jgi:hypothetical protein
VARSRFVCLRRWSAPSFLNKAAHTSDPVERFKLVMTFAVSGFFNTVENQKGKPFNPVLGETYQATFEDGTRIHAEQASHHPPITCWQVFGPEDCYHFYGFGEWSASFRGNSVKGYRFCHLVLLHFALLCTLPGVL